MEWRQAGIARASGFERRWQVGEQELARGSRLILFSDSSARVMLYLQESVSDTGRSQTAANDLLAVCRVSWVELMSALARRLRERALEEAAIAAAQQRFEADW